MDGDKWEPCPRCGSNKVKKQSIFWMPFLTGFGTMGCGIWLLFVPLVGIAMIAFGGLVTLVGLLGLVAAVFGVRLLECEDCGKTWRYPAEKKADAEV